MDEARIPKLPKIPFIVADALLVITALIIANSGSGPLNPILFFWVIFCVALGGVLACLPFYVEFKSHMRLAEYDQGQANFENAERIESALAALGQIAQTVTTQAERGEMAANAIEGLVSRLDVRLLTLEEFLDGDRSREAPLSGMVEEMSAQINSSVGSLVRELKASLSVGQSEIRDLLAKSSIRLTESFEKVTAFGEQQLSSEVAEELAGLRSRIEALTEALSRAPAIAPGNVEVVDLAEETPETETGEPTEELESSPEAETESEQTEEAKQGFSEISVEEESEEEKPAAEAEEISTQEAEDESVSPAEVRDEDAVAEDDLENVAESEEEAVAFLSPEEEAELQSEDEDDGLEENEPESAESMAETSEESDEDVGEENEGPEDSEEESEMEPGNESDDEPENAQPDLLMDVPEGSAKAKKAGRKETSLIAQVLIGIGNKPYVRGEGPGLSADKGVPMEFLEIGKWQWVAPEASEPMTITLYKNDQIAAEGEPITLEPGQKRIINPRFPG